MCASFVPEGLTYKFLADSKLTCGGGGECERKCIAQESCTGSAVTCPQSPSAGCDLVCLSTEACFDSSVQCNARYDDASECSLTCTSRGSCMQLHASGHVSVSCPFVSTDVCDADLLATLSPTATPLPRTLAPQSMPSPQPTLPASTMLPTSAPVAPGVLPPPAKEKLEKTTDVASAVALGGRGAGPAAMLVLIKDFGCSVDDVDLQEAEQLDWEFHPTGTEISSGRRRYMLGAIVMNPVVLLCFLVLVQSIAGGIRLVYGVRWEEAQGTAKLPGFLYLPFLFLLQGTSLVSARLAFYPGDDHPLITVFAALVLLVCLCSPAIIHHFVLRRISSGDARCLKDPKLHPEDFVDGAAKTNCLIVAGAPFYLRGPRRRWLYRFVFGDFVWASSGAEDNFVEKYGVIFEGLKYERTWFPVVEMSSMISLSLLSAWRGSSALSCNVRNFIVCALFFGLLVTTVVAPPFLAPFDNLTSALVTGSLLAALILMTVGIWANIEPASAVFGAASYLLIVSAVVVLCKAVWDLSLQIFDIFIGRKTGARRTYRSRIHQLLTRPNPGVALIAPVDEATVNSNGTSAYSQLSNNDHTPRWTPLSPLMQGAENRILLTCIPLESATVPDRLAV
ncbi:hypothetical protein DIPPA_25139 [Diplonema papillatum]|nr:hypothetical protein DIPPA_25139 [Diplonema papillatum]